MARSCQFNLCFLLLHLVPTLRCFVAPFLFHLSPSRASLATFPLHSAVMGRFYCGRGWIRVELVASRQPSSHSFNQAELCGPRFSRNHVPPLARLFHTNRSLPTTRGTITPHLKRSASADEYINYPGRVHYACSLHYDGGWAAETPPTRMKRQNREGQDK